MSEYHFLIGRGKYLTTTHTSFELRGDICFEQLNGLENTGFVSTSIYTEFQGVKTAGITVEDWVTLAGSTGPTAH